MKNSTITNTHLLYKEKVQRILDQVDGLVGSDFVRKVAGTFASRVFLIGVGLVTSVMVARALGPEGRGYYAVAVTISAIGIQIGNLGLHAANTYYLSQDQNLLSSLLGNSLVTSFIIGGGIALIAWVIFKILPQIAPINGTLQTLALVWIPFGLAYLLSQNILLGKMDVRSYNIIEIFAKVLGVALIGSLVLMKYISVEAFYLMALVSLIVSLVWLLWRLINHHRSIPIPSLTLFKNTIRYGMRAYIAALFAYLVLKIDLLMVKEILGPNQAGQYSIAVSMAEMIYLLPVTVGTILFPKLSSLVGNREKWEFTKKTTLVIGIVMTAISISAILLAKPIVLFLFEDVFLPSIPAFIWLMPAIVILSINTILMNYFASMGMPPITIYSTGIAAFINILLNIKLIPVYGIVGSSIASIFSYSFMLIVSLLYIRIVYRK